MHNLDSVKAAIRDVQAAWPTCHIGTSIYNGSIRKRGPFLQGSLQQLRDSVDGSMCVLANSFAFYVFAQEIMRAYESHGQGGTLLVTGATSSLRGAENFPIFGAASA